MFEGDWRCGKYRFRGIHQNLKDAYHGMMNPITWFSSMHRSGALYPEMHCLQVRPVHRGCVPCAVAAVAVAAAAAALCCGLLLRAAACCRRCC